MNETSSSLGFFTPTGTEVPGILAYGLWRPEAPELVVSAGGDAGAVANITSGRMSGESWQVLEWRLEIRVWPTELEWPGFLHHFLRQPVHAGAIVAWCAAEGNFADPPGLFEPDVMGTQVYAAYSLTLGFLCSAFIGEPFTPFSPDIYRIVGQLANSEPVD